MPTIDADGIRKSTTGLRLFAGALLAAMSSVSASNLTFSPIQPAAPDTSFLVQALFQTGADSISGLQFDLQYDSTAMQIVPILGQATRISGKSLYSTDVGPNKKRFLIVGLNKNSIGDGVLLEFLISVAAGASDGVYPFAIMNVVAVDPGASTRVPSAASTTIPVQSSAPGGVRLEQAGVRNSASFLAGPVAPGEVVTLIGSDLGPDQPAVPDAKVGSATVLSGAQVLFDGTAAPLLYAARNQITLVVPYEVFNEGTTNLQLRRADQTIASLDMPVAAASPGIFTLDASGVGPGGILNSDFSVNSPSNPATQGSSVVMYATGAGQTDPAGVDGQITGDVLPKPIGSVSVRVGDMDAQVSYAGAAPALIAGILQVNFIIPANAPVGPAVPVVLSVGSANSPQGVTMSVR
jgi:uncharacterized protein (TIGR03437 family)